MSMTQEERLKEIITLLEEKGYDPIEQLSAYIMIENLNYITRHGGARDKIKEIDIGYIKGILKNNERTM